MEPYEIHSDSAKYIIVNGLKQYSSGTLNGRIIERTQYHTPVRRLYFDIPLEVSYGKVWNKWEGEISMSYNFNISHQYFGRSYSEDQILLSQDQLREQGVYKSYSVNRTNFEARINRHLSTNVSLGLSLNYWRQLSSSLGGNNSIDEHYRGIGIGLNLKKTF